MRTELIAVLLLGFVAAVVIAEGQEDDSESNDPTWYDQLNFKRALPMGGRYLGKRARYLGKRAAASESHLDGEIEKLMRMLEICLNDQSTDEQRIEVGCFGNSIAKRARYLGR